MKKNGQYVGVDEKYIPEEEKYVDNSINQEVTELVHDGIKSAKDYISDKDNQEKIKKAGKKGLKFLKGIGIGYLAFLGFVILMALIIFIVILTMFFKINNNADRILDDTTNVIDSVNDTDHSGDSLYEISSFNGDLEIYKGTKYGTTVSILLDNVATKIKKNKDHPISVIYGSTTLSNADEIIALKKQFDNMTKYEISFDYDSDGFINTVTIANY